MNTIAPQDMLKNKYKHIFFIYYYVVFTFHHQNCRQVSAYWNLRL